MKAAILILALALSGCINQGHGWGAYPDSPFYGLAQGIEKLDRGFQGGKSSRKRRSAKEHLRHAKKRCKILNTAGTPDFQACVDLHIENDNE